MSQGTYPPARPPEDPGESSFDRIRQMDEDGREYWSARDLQVLMGYEKWERFDGAVQRAIRSLENAGTYSEQAISQTREMVPQGGPARVDYLLNRHAAYVLAMNGDPIKPQVAAAQHYFAGKTREAELATSKPMSEIEMARSYVAALEREEWLTKELVVTRPKAGKWDAFINSDGLIGMTEMANALGVEVKKLTAWLVEISIFRVQKSRNGGNRNMPRQPHQDNGLFVVKFETNNGVVFPVVYATPKGIDLVADLWEKKRPAA